MLKRENLLPLLTVLSFIAPAPVFCQTAPEVSFSFSLGTAARTSAGVFAPDGTLIRTLWSGVSLPTGNYARSWDGLTDEHRLAPPGDYQVRLLSNNVTYDWQGVLGNTSIASTGESVVRGLYPISSMVISGTAIYAGRNYNEGGPSPVKISTVDIGRKINIGRNTTNNPTGQQTMHVATDGTRVYWAGHDPIALQPSFVFATNTSDDLQSSFSAGKALTTEWGFVYSSAIAVTSGANFDITGMAVQRLGSYLFIARRLLNRIDVLSKTTGALSTTLSVASPRAMMVDASDNLWVASGTSTLARYTVGTGGTLSSATLSISGLTDPLAMAVSPDGATMAVADGGNQQQVKGFSTSTGTQSWTLGTAGGYASSPDVTSTKFMFSLWDRGEGRSKHVVDYSYLAYQPDGSLWVGDPGNYRSLRFNASRVYVDQIQYMPIVRSCGVNQTDPTRVFVDYLEFAVKYSLPLSAGNGSWTQVKNWRYNASEPSDNEFMRLRYVTTLSNSRTYALTNKSTVWNQNSGKFAVVELSPTGLRDTGLEVPNNGKMFLDADGSLRRITHYDPGVAPVWYRRALTGFDGSNNPIWGAETTVITGPAAVASDPIDRGYIGWEIPTSTPTATGVIVSAEIGQGLINGSTVFSQKWHLGGLRPGHSGWLWKTAADRSTSYAGDYPANGDYDIGNGGKYIGGYVLTKDRSIFWNHHGEFWKQGQTNYYQHVYDNGLFLGRFGEERRGGDHREAVAGVAGNNLTGGIAKVGADYYIYHCDESAHGGLHRWKVSGLNTIQEQTIPLSLVAPPQGLLAQYYEGTDLNSANLSSTIITSVVQQAVQSKSVRWRGFVQPPTSGDYTFYTNTGNKVRLWVDDARIINKWTNAAQTEYSSQVVSLTAGKQYAVRMEISGGSATLSWSSANQPKQLIPGAYLYPLRTSGSTTDVDLLEGLPFNNVLENDLYGWTRNPVEETTTDPYSNYWSLKTNVGQYNPFESPDLYTLFMKPSATHTLIRSLGNRTGLVSWRINGTISLNEGFFNNGELGENKSGGFYLDVLDASDKVIARIHTKADFGKEGQPSQVLCNGKIIGQGSYFDVMRDLFAAKQPIDIRVTNGIMTLGYGPYNPVTMQVFDPAANIQSPKAVRLLFWDNGQHYQRIVDIHTLHFLTSAALAPRSSDLSLSLQTDKRSLNVGETVSMRLNIRNNGIAPDDSPVQARWSCRLPPNLQLVSSNGMTYANNTLSGMVQNIAGRADTTFVFQARAMIAGMYRTSAQITTTTTPDPDSKQDSGTADGEDDMGVVDFRTNQSGINVFVSPNPNQTALPSVATTPLAFDSAKADLSLVLTLSNRAPLQNEVLTGTLLIRNTAGADARSIQLQYQLPDGLQFVDGAGWSVQGNLLTYNLATLLAGTTATLSLRVRAITRGHWTNYAQISLASPADPDSTPGNGFANGEDDQATTDVRVR